MADKGSSVEFTIPEEGGLGGGRLSVSSVGEQGRRLFQAAIISGWDAGDDLSIIESSDGSMMIEVTQEQAVDSYNSDFTCSMRLPSGAANLLRKWFSESPHA